MIKKQICAALLALLMALGSCAAAQTLPGSDVFSPGLIRLSEKMAKEPSIRAEAAVTVDNAFYARDLSLLAAMLDGTTFCYEGDASSDRLTIVRGEEVLGDFAICGNLAEINGKAYALDGDQSILKQLTGLPVPDSAKAAEAAEKLQDVAILERVPLAAVADFLEGLKAGDPLGFGFTVAEAITLKRTMSDDGTRLTRIDFETGAIAREGEAPYVITGHMRQHGGRAPKDTFELAIRRDDANFIELSYSALHESKVVSKNKKGEASVRTALKAAGKIAGSGISSRLTVTMGNQWTADGEALHEKVTVTATLAHQDNTPGKRMQRLNKADVKLRSVIGITTHEAGDEILQVTDAMTVEAVMDENTFLKAGADFSMEIGGAIERRQASAAEETTADAAIGEAVRDMASAVYPLLDDSARKKAENGL